MDRSEREALCKTQELWHYRNELWMSIIREQLVLSGGGRQLFLPPEPVVSSDLMSIGATLGLMSPLTSEPSAGFHRRIMMNCSHSLFGSSLPFFVTDKCKTESFLCMRTCITHISTHVQTEQYKCMWELLCWDMSRSFWLLVLYYFSIHSRLVDDLGVKSL